MMDAFGKAGPFSNRSQWFAPLNDTAYHAEPVVAILRDLAHKAVRYHFEDGALPSLTRADAKALQPLFGGSDWADKRPQAYLGFLNSVLYFTGKDADFRTNEMVLAVGATTRVRFWQRWALRKRVKGAALVGGEALVPVLLEGAWSAPSVQMHLLEALRKNWHARTLLYPDDIDWPDRVSIEVVLILVLLALVGQEEEGSRSSWALVRFLKAVQMRPVRRMEGLLLGWLSPALAALGDGVDIEHLVVTDAIARMPNSGALEAVNRFCSRTGLAELYGWLPLSEGEADEKDGDEQGVPADMADSGLKAFAVSPVSEEEQAVLALGQRLATGLL
ncbi:hypothetical protein [uncultured Cohaesibacter sp.]|uniref:hypothetical protein n=1 Tax=uncultured Cohaesibacter sp. TaxID=1002546 RepID=UPI002AAB52AC|nr:hypothetical protein [uncultured Cohaesibacter sp.]